MDKKFKDFSWLCMRHNVLTVVNIKFTVV